MNIVLDTNVIVAGLLSPFSPCGALVRMVAAGELRLCADARLLSEYSEVLRRSRFGFDPERVSALMDQVAHSAVLVSASPLDRGLPDPDDNPFLEVALAGQAVHLVTGNLRHYPPHLREGMSVLSPRDFIDQYARRRARSSRLRPGTERDIRDRERA
jgi:uncharacterized protein